MKRNLLLATLIVALLPCASTFGTIAIDTVTIGNPGNASDAADGDFTSGVQHFGAVGYTYSIGKYEVTVGQYAVFLNAVGATDTYALYDTHGVTTDIYGIAKSGASGNYSYSVIGSPNHPIAHVSWGNAARFSNWLHNGQPTGAQNASTTEDGAYTLNGATSGAALSTVSRNANAKWFIPTENEWYKAAYHQPAAQGGDSDDYWNYPMRTNNVPYSDQPPGETPDNTRVGNFYQNDGLANGYDDGNATDFCQGQNCLTDVGAYASSPSYYGTFDQGGNVWEWNESLITSGGLFRSHRGGSWRDFATHMRVSVRYFNGSIGALTGFRVATLPVPEPSGVALLVGTLAVLAIRSRRNIRR